MVEFVASATRRGTDHLRLVTDAKDGAAAFYERLGWKLVGRRGDVDGGTWTELHLDL